MEEATFSKALDAIYDAAAMPERWTAALQHIGEAIGCSYVGLLDRNLRTMEGRATAIGIDLASQREYFDVWSKRDLVMQRTRAYRSGAVETDSQIIPRSDLVRSDYYNEFLKPRDMHAYLRMTLSVDGGFRKIISMTRPISLGTYEAAEVEHCHRLMPHLQRAARITQEIEESRLNLAAYSDFLEQNTAGIILLDCAGRVLTANRAARAMAQASDCFVLRRDRVEALCGRDDIILRRLIAGATGRIGRFDAARGGAMRLTRRSGKPDLAVVAAPLPSRTTWMDYGSAAFILITDPDATSLRPKAIVAQLFGLSATEARVAERLMKGDTPEEAAIILNIKISTLRWHLASLYRKTDTNGQPQLMRLLLSLPMI